LTLPQLRRRGVAKPELALYGHPFSSYTWKALIALYANETPFEFRIVDADHPAHCEVVAQASPQGKFPLLADGDTLIFEATSIIEYLNLHHPGRHVLIPRDPDAAADVRKLDRVFDNYVMNQMQPVVDEHLRNPAAPDQSRIAEAKLRLPKSYAWLEEWLEHYPTAEKITLVECAAAPALFYADWVVQIGDAFPRLQAWRAHLLSLPPVARCVDEARPYRSYFPLGAPDRD
jgi:glutathione S-transferase